MIKNNFDTEDLFYFILIISLISMIIIPLI